MNDEIRLACQLCDRTDYDPTTMQEAVEDGWFQIEGYTPSSGEDSAWWTCMGTCPPCHIHNLNTEIAQLRKELDRRNEEIQQHQADPKYDDRFNSGCIAASVMIMDTMRNGTVYNVSPSPFKDALSLAKKLHSLIAAIRGDA